MRVLLFAMVLPLLGACGGPGKRAHAPPPSKAPLPSEDDEPTAAPAPVKKPPPPKNWFAKAALTPVKGARVKPFLVAFSQEEGADTKLVADPILNLKAGAYHVVIHDGAACGPNGTKAGAARAGGVSFAIAKDGSGGLEPAMTQLALDGDDSIIGHTIVLHQDKKGGPGKILACGAIEAADDAE